MEGNGRGPPDDPASRERPDLQTTRGSGLIFVLIAMALILAIGFFYLTKDRESDHGRALTEAADSADSAARLVGDAAQNAADQLDNRRD